MHHFITIQRASLVAAFLAVMAPFPQVHSFSATMFHEKASMQKTTLSKTEGVEIELPNFEELFNRIQQVSPLAKLAITGEEGGFETADKISPSTMKWKTIEANKRRTVHRIDKIENFQNLKCPIVRFRSSLKGPISGDRFAEFIMNLEERKNWDPQIKEVEETYPIYDVEAANLAMGVGRYGDCSMLGIGYCQTKSNIVVDGREQLTLCGVQNFPNGATIIWGTEMEEWQNHLLPPIERHTRAKSHLFSTTLVPTGPDSFDVEYVLQLEVGGKIPSFLTTPILVETVKSLFKYADKVFSDEKGMQEFFDKEKELDDEFITERHSLFMTP
jgi:hypothetical protein